MNAPPSTPLHPTPLRFSRLLLTGAAGALGRELRRRLPAYCEVLRVSDIAPLGEARPHEEVRPAALEDPAAMFALLEGVDAVVHLGGVSTERPFEEVLPANIVGVWNLYGAARRAGTRRVVYASSNHATGFHEQARPIDAAAPLRPDGCYGLSKAFGENCAQFHFDRHGIETVSLRIGSCFPEPRDRRMLSTWLSYDDLERLVVASLTAPAVGHTVIYGISDNAAHWYDNRLASHIGYRPQDSSEPWRRAIEAAQPQVDPRNPAMRFQGGGFVVMGPHD